MAVNLIRKNNSDAITAAMDAAMYFMMVGEGVFDKIGNSCAASISDNKMVIQSGLLSLGGRILEIPSYSPVEIDEINRFGKEKPIYIKANVTIEEDDSQSKATVYASIDSAQSARHALTGADVYTTNLFIVTWNSASNSYTAKRTIFVLEPGVAKYADSLLTTGRIGNTPVTDIFQLSGNAVGKVYQCKEAENADVAYGLKFKANSKGDNLNAVDEDLYMPNRGVYICTDAVLINNATVTVKNANFDVDITEDTSTVEIPFDSRVTFDPTENLALAKITIGAHDFFVTGGKLRNGDSYYYDGGGNWMLAYEIQINRSSKTVLLRLPSAHDSDSDPFKVNVTLHAIIIGATGAN